MNLEHQKIQHIQFIKKQFIKHNLLAIIHPMHYLLIRI